MTLILTPELLAQPAAVSTRIIANRRLDVCADALDQLDNGDPEALHDLRVALRRLRTWLRNFRPYLDDTVRAKRQRRLRRLVRATNDARDREVWLVWLAEQADLAPSHRRAARALAERLESECKSMNDDALVRVRERLPRIIASLRADLSTYTRRLDGESGVMMAQATADAIRDGLARFGRRMEGIESEDDVSKIHDTRIAAKRLRYVLETIESDPAKQAVQRLTSLQDRLGAVHDMHLLIAHLLSDIESAVASEARRRALAALEIDEESLDQDGTAGAALPRRATPGLTELARRARDRARTEFGRYHREWSAARVASFNELVEQIATDLEALR